MQSTTNNNAVDFLLDGNEYFSAVHEQLRNLEAAPIGATTYVRMAFWEFSHEAYLPAYTDPAGHRVPGCLLKDLLYDIAKKGHIVQLIAWYGTWAVRRFRAEMRTNQKLETWVNTTNGGQNPVAYRNIQLYMEPYGRFVTGCSTHQKIAVISINNAKRAFVGGENMSPHYLSDTAHNYKNWWHDSAVCVRGPAVDDIEEEWRRRWLKQQVPPAPSGQAAAAQPNAGGLTIRVATTNSEANPVETDIRTQMIMRINNAANLIYMENYALTDPMLVSALAARLRGHNPPRVIIVVNHPRSASMDVDVLGLVYRQEFNPFAYLMYYTYAELALPGCQSFSAVNTWRSWLTRNPVVYQNANVTNPNMRKFGLNPNAMARFNPVNAFRYDFDDNGNATYAWLRDIWDITTNDHVMYAPKSNNPNGDLWPYPHSKLAVFDDDFLCVGTSNWTYRSMQYDGEIELFIRDGTPAPNFVTAARDRLWTHWNQRVTPVHWSGDADQNVLDLAAGNVPLEETRVVPLGLTDFIHPASGEAWWRMASTAGALGSAYL